MDTKDIMQASESTKRLVQNEEYYKYIFKKTEKIVSVVFYILHNLENDPKNSAHIEDIQHSARHAHDAVLQSLETRAHVAEDVIRASAHSLIVLDSKLRVAHIAGLIAPDVMHVLTSEIDSVLRGMNKFLKSTNAFDDTEYQLMGVDEPRRGEKKVSRATERSSVPSSTQSPTASVMDRRERIRMVLEAKGESTIKDIAAIVTECSEKTIQRELNAMIDDNVVKRQGERRWSKYSLF